MPPLNWLKSVKNEKTAWMVAEEKNWRIRYEGFSKPKLLFQKSNDAINNAYSIKYIFITRSGVITR